MIRTVLPLVCLSVAACGVTRDSYPDHYASVWCDRLKECDRGLYELRFDGRTECEDQIAADVEEGLQLAEHDLGCTLDLDQSVDCLRAVRKASCGEFVLGDFGGQCDVALVDC